MTLEDHVGDVIRKARLGTGAAVETVAKAAGLSDSELSLLEDSGKSSKRPNWEALAGVLKLDGAKLEKLAQGWQPTVPDLSLWRELRQITTTQGGNTVNCYLVWDEVTREAALFDTGWEAQPLIELIEANQLQLRYIFITHSHGDHIAALAPLREKYPKARLRSGSKNAPPDQRNRANDFLHLGSLRLTNRETPGHAEDGVTYIVGTFPEDAPNVVIVGDALFAGSMGGAKEHFELARQKVREQILSLPADTLICPGHGPMTTVEQEKAHNPFF